MTGAFWCQLAVVGFVAVFVVLQGVGTILSRRVFGDSGPPDSLTSLSPLLVLALWLLASAFGLRAGNRWAHRLSLAGLLLPPLLLLAALLIPGLGSHHQYSFIGTPADMATVEAWIAWEELESMISPFVIVSALALMVTTAMMLLSGASRRHFARPAGRPEPAGHVNPPAA